MSSVFAKLNSFLNSLGPLWLWQCFSPILRYQNLALKPHLDLLQANFKWGVRHRAGAQYDSEFSAPKYISCFHYYLAMLRWKLEIAPFPIVLVAQRGHEAERLLQNYLSPCGPCCPFCAITTMVQPRQSRTVQICKFYGKCFWRTCFRIDLQCYIYKELNYIESEQAGTSSCSCSWWPQSSVLSF